MNNISESVKKFLDFDDDWFSYYEEVSGKKYKEEDIQWFLSNVWELFENASTPIKLKCFVYPIPDNKISLEWETDCGICPSFEVDLETKTGTLHVCDLNDHDNQIINCYIEDLDLKKKYDYAESVSPDGKVKEVKINGAVFVLGSTVINKTADDVKKVLLKTYPDAMNIVITTDHDMNNTYYEANFITKKFKGEAKFNPATGVIIQRTLAYY